MKPVSAAFGVIVVASLLACSVKSCGRTAHKVVPAVEKIDPEWATEPVPCDEPFPTPSLRGCIMDTVTCGQEIEGSTIGGVNKFGDDFYQHNYCTPERNDYEDSPEAIYALEVPADIQADIMMTTDCGDLDLIAANWSETNRCPTLKHRIHECEMDTKGESSRLTLTTVNRAQTYLLIVDGKHGAEGNFRISVKCHTYR